MAKIFNYGDVFIYEHSYDEDDVVVKKGGKLVRMKVPSQNNISMRMIEDPYAFQRYVTVIVKTRKAQIAHAQAKQNVIKK